MFPSCKWSLGWAIQGTQYEQGRAQWSPRTQGSFSLCPPSSTQNFQSRVQDGWLTSTITSTLNPSRRGMRRRACLLTLTPRSSTHNLCLHPIGQTLITKPYLVAREAGKCSLWSAWPGTHPTVVSTTKVKKERVDLGDNQQNPPQHINNGLGFLMGWN